MKNLEWDLCDIYKTEEDLQNDVKLIKNIIKKLKKFKGKLNTEAALLEYLTITEDMNIRLGKLYLIKSLKCEEDVLDKKASRELRKVEFLTSKSEYAQLFFKPEVKKKISQEILEEMIKNEPRLEKYRSRLEKIIKPNKKHLPSNKPKQKISFFKGILELISKIYYLSIDFSGKYFILRNSKLKSENISLKDVKKISKKYISLIKQGLIVSKMEKYSSYFEKMLKIRHSSIELYNSVIQAVNDNISVNHRYYQLKKKWLGLEKMYKGDMYAPIMKEKSEENYSYEEAKNIVLNALKPLGDEYINTLKEAYGGNWVYVYPKENTNHQAFTRCRYGVHPYILLNFKGILRSVYTVAHEFGHAIHFYYNKIFQDYSNSGSSIIVSEVAANTNEILLANYLNENEQSIVQKIIYLQEEIEKFSSAVVKQAMRAEFERDIHLAVSKGEMPTCEQLCNYYGSLAKKYYGDAVEDSIDMQHEWATIQHFFRYPFYVYQFVIGRASAIEIVERILEEGDNYAKEYVEMLKKGSSIPPLEQLKSIGIDFSTDELITKAFVYYEKKIDELEKLMNEINR